MIKAAQELEAQGAKGISSDCGFFMNFQNIVAKALAQFSAVSNLTFQAVANDAAATYERLGSPEGDLALALASWRLGGPSGLPLLAHLVLLFPRSSCPGETSPAVNPRARRHRRRIPP